MHTRKKDRTLRGRQVRKTELRGEMALEKTCLQIWLSSLKGVLCTIHGMISFSRSSIIMMRECKRKRKILSVEWAGQSHVSLC